MNKEVELLPPAFAKTVLASSNMKCAEASLGWFGIVGMMRFLPLYLGKVEMVNFSESENQCFETIYYNQAADKTDWINISKAQWYISTKNHLSLSQFNHLSQYVGGYSGLILNFEPMEVDYNGVASL